MEKRRKFLKSMALSTGAIFTSNDIFSRPGFNSDIKISCQEYTWRTFFERESQTWMKNPDESFTSFKESGLMAYEPSFLNSNKVIELKPILHKFNLKSKSMYVNSILHEPELVDENISNVLAIAKEAKSIGGEILVTNPSPIAWGGKGNKTDKQIKSQAVALNLLGKELASIGIKLAYHNHDIEMRASAREFHHMLTATNPEYVHLCLDSHWIYRGSGNSQVALFDIVELYADRIVELHLRQSIGGVWSEVFDKGDIDYGRLADILKSKNIIPHLVLEQAVEEGTPYTMPAVEAIKKSVVNIKNVFA